MTMGAARKGSALAAAFLTLQAPAHLAPRVARAQAPAQPAPFADVIEELAPRLGYKGAYQIKAKPLTGDFRVVKVTFGDGTKQTSVVIKKYPGLKTIVRALSFVRVPARHIAYRLTSAGQFKATVEMAAAFKAAGLNAMDILLAIPQRKIMVTRFLEGAVGMDKVAEKAAAGNGESLSLVEEFGRKLAQVHRAGLAMGDMNPANAMAVNGEIYFTDLDHASRNGNKTFDLALFLLLDARSRSRNSPAVGPDGVVAQAFLKGYLENGGSAEDVSSARHFRYALKANTFFAHPRKHLQIQSQMAAELESALRRS